MNKPMINGFEVKPDWAWLMKSGDLAVITSVSRSDKEFFKVEGFIHIASNGRPGFFSWTVPADGTYSDTSIYGLLVPVSDKLPAEFVKFGPNKPPQRFSSMVVGGWIPGDKALSDVLDFSCLEVEPGSVSDLDGSSESDDN